jgi:FixJ family two-component response regulator
VEGRDVNRANEVLSVHAISRSASLASVVFVVDADPSVRASLESLVTGAGWQPRSFASGKEFLSQPRVMVPSCLVSDVTLPDMSGLEVQRLLANRPELPIIFMSARVDISAAVQAIRAGGLDFLTKPISEERLVEAMQHGIERSWSALNLQAQIRALERRYESLSRREREVMDLVVSGRLNKQVGGDLGIREDTVKAHRGRVMRKMQARSFAELVNIAASLRHLRPSNG